MADSRVSTPHIKDGNSQLESLIFSALRRFGDFAPDTSDGHLMSMMIEFANLTVDDVRNHPYWDDTQLDYYTAVSESGYVPDQIMIAGLLTQYAVQQMSDKAQVYTAFYYKTLNQELWNRLNTTNTEDGGGNRSVAIQIRPMDSSIEQSIITGQVKTT
tara:strand:+ start:2863 stop:3336 length:474 start_codon:yes stop_codon:yes gene_type:complete